MRALWLFVLLLGGYSQAAIVSFEASPNPITPNQPVTISWAATNARWCDLMNVETGQRGDLPDTSGSLTTDDITETTRLRLICRSSNNSTTWRETITVIVNPAPDPDPDPDPEPDPDPPPTANCGGLKRGIADPCAHFGYDVFGTYAVDSVVTGSHGDMALNGTGTAENPYVIDASGATFRRLGVTGKFVIVQGGRVNLTSGGGQALVTQCDQCVLRDVEVSGPRTDQGHSAAVVLADNTVWLRGSIHGFGSRTSATENDYHGIKSTNGKNIWVIDAEIYDNAGDSIQVGDATGSNAENIYISGGHYHDNRENAVDIKTARNVVVSGVRMSGFSSTNSSSGVALVLHNGATNGKVYDNIITDSVIGIVSSGFTGHEITNNTIQAQLGIDLRSTSNLTVTGNQITAQQCINKTSSATGTIQSGCN